MAQEKKWQYEKWEIADDTQQKNIKKIFQFKAVGMVLAYVVFLAVVVLVILSNILTSNNIWFDIIFALLALSAVAGLGNQVKITREIRERNFEIRDAFVSNVQYTNKRQYHVLSYEVEISEHNIRKKLAVTKSYTRFHPKTGDHVFIVRPEKTPHIYFYKKAEE